ncbi:unnamed protein product [Paramecium sonneborni]|uniref:Cyclin n=1 Tax=Paramecium sonneborni TaxID=65129 RepID=A0A8S1KV32_9CILI|nr:unnamed protein product [Paramecium sonneborni]
MTSALDYDVDQMSEMFIKLSGQIIYRWNSCGQICKFSQRSHPQIGYCDYLKRLLLYSDCSIQYQAIVLIYLDRFTNKNEHLWLDQASLYSLTLVLLVISIKFWNDRKYGNKYFAKIGGISLRLMNEMEQEVLELMNYDLFVQDDVIFRYMKYFS